MRKSNNYNKAYVCPNCGNEAPARLRYDRPVVCKFCRCSYKADERVVIKVDKH